MNNSIITHRHRQLLRSLVFFSIIAVFCMAATIWAWIQYTGPYTKFYNARAELMKESAIYLQQPMCTDPSIQVKLKNVNECDYNKDIMNSDPSKVAFHQLMEELKICKNGKCVLFGINLTDSWWFVVQAAFVIFVILWLLSIFGIANTRYNQYQLQQTLPYGSMPPQHQQQHYYQQQQQQPFYQQQHPSIYQQQTLMQRTIQTAADNLMDVTVSKQTSNYPPMTAITMGDRYDTKKYD